MYKNHDEESLVNLLRQLDDSAARLRQIIQDMRVYGLGTVRCQYQKEMERAIQAIPNFIESGRDNVLKQRVELGQFAGARREMGVNGSAAGSPPKRGPGRPPKGARNG